MKRRFSVLSGMLVGLLVLSAVAAEAPAVKKAKTDPVPIQIRSGQLFLVPLTDGTSGPARCENIDGKARMTIIAGGQFVDLQLTPWGTPIPPPPPPPPPPVEPLWGAVLIRETTNQTPELAALLTDQSLRSFFFGNSLAFRVADPDEKGSDGKPPADLTPYIDRAKQVGLPRLFMLGTKGAVLYEGFVPDSAAALVDLTKKFLTQKGGELCPGSSCPVGK